MTDHDHDPPRQPRQPQQPRTIDTRIEIDAPPEAVWDAIATAEGLVNWFPIDARVEPGAGGSIWVSWGPEQAWETPIDAWDPPRHLRLVYAEPTPPPKPGDSSAAFHVPFRVAVDYHLQAREGGGTVLRLVHSGFASGPGWDEQYDGTRRGWAFELRGLKHYLEHHRGARRAVVHARHPLGDLTLDEAWSRITGPRGLAAQGRLTAPGERYRLETAGGDALQGEIRIHEPPRDLCATVESLNNAFLRLRIDLGCLTAPTAEANLFLSTYGLDDEQVDGLRRRFQRLLDSQLGTTAPAAGTPAGPATRSRR